MTLVEIEPILAIILLIIVVVIMFSCCMFTCTEEGPIAWILRGE
jgi:hypothetical protein